MCIEDVVDALLFDDGARLLRRFSGDPAAGEWSLRFIAWSAVRRGEVVARDRIVSVELDDAPASVGPAGSAGESGTPVIHRLVVRMSICFRCR
ncbi:hypothetical protein DIE06_21640 [Burkholderia sp. Bp8998]|nr:hypothetical protein DIE06_21640 [Burkholderia sp. Bp8998]